MLIRNWLLLVGMLVVGWNPGWGQNQPENPPAQGTEPSRPTPSAALSGIMGVDTGAVEDTDSGQPQIPSFLGGRGSTLALASETERSNYLRGGINVGAAYDDNAVLAPGGAEGNVAYSVFPNIALEQTTSRMRWSLGYGAGLTVNQRLSSRNQGAHDLRFDSQFRLSPHVSLRAAEDFSLTAGIFGTGAGASIPGGGGGGNSTFITPLANRRSSQTVVETNYHFALKDIVGASGSFYDLHYSDVIAGAGGLTDTRTASGTAFWLHQLIHGDWAGISYQFKRITFDPEGETRVHTFMVNNTVNIGRGFTVSAFLGPEYSDNVGGVTQGTGSSEWAVAGGVEGGWQTARTSVTAGYARQASDGGGVLGAVRLQNVRGALRRELFPGWAVSVGANYGSNRSLTMGSSASPVSIRTTSVGASLDRNIGRSLGLQMGYFHDFQSQSVTSQNLDTNRNRFFVTLSYQWAKALGR